MANQEGVDIIIKATDQYTATINKIAASNELFGKSVQNTEKQISALERYMIALRVNGMEPTDAMMVKLKNDYDKLSQSLNNGQGSLKNSSKQWTSLALVVQDLPYGFRGIQNNLPALFGSIAAAAGPAYFAFSALIAAITFYDQQSQKAAASTKSLYEGFNKLKTETLSLGSIFSAVREGTLSAADATKIFNEKLGDLYGTAKSVYEAEQLYIQKTEGYIKAQYFRAKADIEYEKAKEALAKKDAAYAEDQVGVLGKLATATAAFLKAGAIQGIAGFYKQGTIFAKDYANQQIELAGYVTDYEEAQFQKRLALGQRYMSEAYKIEQQYGIKSTTIKDKTDKAAIAALGKAIEQQQNVNEAVIQNLIDAKKQEVKLFEDDAYKKYEVSKQLAELERRLGEEKIKNGEYTTKQQLALQEGLNVEYANKVLLIDQSMQEQLLNQDAKTRKEKKKRDEESYREQEKFGKNQVDLIDSQLNLSLRLNKGNLIAQQEAIKISMAKTGALMAFSFGTGMFPSLLQFFDQLNGKLSALDIDALRAADALKNMNDALRNLQTNTLVEVGTQLGNIFSGAEIDAKPFFNFLADTLIQLGTQLILTSKLFLAFKALFSNPATAAFAIPVGIAAIAAGVALKNMTSEKTNKFANGGIVSGPTMGLVGEYPGAQSNPEVIAPLDKLKSMIGESGGGGTFVLRGQDLLLSVQKAQKSSKLKGQNINLA